MMHNDRIEGMKIYFANVPCTCLTGSRLFFILHFLRLALLFVATQNKTQRCVAC